jgi:hypothetical protein
MVLAPGPVLMLTLLAPQVCKLGDEFACCACDDEVEELRGIPATVNVDECILNQENFTKEVADDAEDSSVQSSMAWRCCDLLVLEVESF